MEEVKVKRTRKKKAETTANDTTTPIVAPPKKKNYINNADLMKQVALSRAAGAMTDELALMLTMLCARYAKHPDYAAIYSYEEDMKAFAMLTLVKVWKSFNPEKSNNPFAYFTQVTRHAFYQYLNHETKQRLVKDEILVNLGELPSFAYMERYNDEQDDDGDDEGRGHSGSGWNQEAAPVTEIDMALGAIDESGADTSTD